MRLVAGARLPVPEGRAVITSLGIAFSLGLIFGTCWGGAITIWACRSQINRVIKEMKDEESRKM